VICYLGVTLGLDGHRGCKMVLTCGDQLVTCDCDEPSLPVRLDKGVPSNNCLDGSILLECGQDLMSHTSVGLENNGLSIFKRTEKKYTGERKYAKTL